jgi:hypothetical protein
VNVLQNEKWIEAARCVAVSITKRKITLLHKLFYAGAVLYAFKRCFADTQPSRASKRHCSSITHLERAIDLVHMLFSHIE